MSNENSTKFYWSASLDATSWDGPFCAFWVCLDCGTPHLGHVEGQCRKCHPTPDTLSALEAKP